MSRKLFSFSGECVLQRNGIEVAMKNNTAKNKTFRLVTSQPLNEPLHENLCDLSVLIGNSEDVLYTFKLERLKKLHSTFINEGRITLQVAENFDLNAKKSHIPSDISLKDAMKNESYLFIMIKGVSTEQLKSFCRVLAEIKSKKNLPEKPNSSQGSQSLSKPNLTLKKEPNIMSDKLPSGIDSEKDDSSKRIIRKLTQETDNSKFKANRAILTELTKNQNSNPLKRKFGNLSNDLTNEEQDILKGIKKVKLNPSLTKSILEYLPDSVITHILKFLTTREFVSQKLVCQSFYKLINGLKTVLDFRGKGDIPSNVIIKYVNSCKNAEKIFMGPSKRLNQTQFLEDIHFNLPRLKFVDFTAYVNLSDKMVLKLYRSCKALQQLKFGYYSNVTDTVVETIPSYLENIKAIYFKCPNKNHVNKREKLTDTCFAKFVNKYEKLETLSIFILGSNFFSKAFQKILLNLQTLKVDQIIFQKEEDLSLISNIKQCINLEYLKIGNIKINQWDVTDISKEKVEIFESIFQETLKLKKLKFGQFTSNYLAMGIAKHVRDLSRFIVSSDTLDDDGLTHILKKAEGLVHLDISRCRMINGHCLENICSKVFRRLVVSFDDYRCKCTQALFLEKGLLGQTTLFNVNKKKY